MPRIIRGSLFEVLSQRGELAAARAVIEQGGWRGISSLLARELFPDLGSQDLSTVFRLAFEGLEAAARLTFAPSGQEVDPLQFPVNAALFQGTPSAARSLVAADIIPPGEGLDRAIRITFEMTGGETVGRLRELARGELASRIARSPQGFGIDAEAADDIQDALSEELGDVIFTFAESAL